jgi:hypothetical protein
MVHSTGVWLSLFPSVLEKASWWYGFQGIPMVRADWLISIWRGHSIQTNHRIYWWAPHWGTGSQMRWRPKNSHYQGCSGFYAEYWVDSLFGGSWGRDTNMGASKKLWVGASDIFKESVIKLIHRTNSFRFSNGWNQSKPSAKNCVKSTGNKGIIPTLHYNWVRAHTASQTLYSLVVDPLKFYSWRWRWDGENDKLPPRHVAPGFSALGAAAGLPRPVPTAGKFYYGLNFIDKVVWHWISWWLTILNCSINSLLYNSDVNSQFSLKRSTVYIVIWLAA